MQIRVGYELIYECPQATPMILTLNIHATRASDIVVPDVLTTDPRVPSTAYHDGFGNWCTRIVAPAGRIRIASTGVVRDSGGPDDVAPSAYQHLVQDLPVDTLIFLLGSRYCETDHLSQAAWDLFDRFPLGWPQSPGGLRLRTSSHYLRLRARQSQQDGRAGVQRAPGRLPRLCPSGHRLLPLPEHSGSLLHGLSGRYWLAAALCSDGLRRLV